MSKQLVGVLHTERRVSPRFAVEISVLFMLDGVMMRAIAEDVSTTGMRLACDADLEVGTQLDCR